MKHYRDRVQAPREPRGEAEPNLNEYEEQNVAQYIRPNAAVIHEVVRLDGENALKRPVSDLAWSGLAAGLSMGFSLVGRGLLEAHLPDQSWRPIITSLGYSLGFLIVVMGRQQLFTQTTLTAVLPLLSHRNRRTWKRMLRLWGVVLVSNLVGTLIFAWLVGHTDVFSPQVQTTFGQIGMRTLDGDLGPKFLGGLFSGWLIALMVWLFPGAESARIWIIVFITATIGLSNFSHVIAGSVETLYVVILGDASWGAYFGSFLIPALIGNIIGGVSLVAMLNHAQVSPN